MQNQLYFSTVESFVKLSNTGTNIVGNDSSTAEILGSNPGSFRWLKRGPQV